MITEKGFTAVAVEADFPDASRVNRYDFATAICEAAERKGADVICMGTKGHSLAGAALLGATVQAVIARAHRSVFVVTPPLA